MINNKLIFISVTFSLLFHFTIIFFFTSKTNDKELYVVNLSEFREFSFVQPAPPKPKKIIKKQIEDKPIERSKILDNKNKETERKRDVVALKKKTQKKKLKKLTKFRKSSNQTKKKFRKRK